MHFPHLGQTMVLLNVNLQGFIQLGGLYINLGKFWNSMSPQSLKGQHSMLNSVHIRWKNNTVIRHASFCPAPHCCIKTRALPVVKLREQGLGVQPKEGRAESKKDLVP